MTSNDLARWQEIEKRANDARELAKDRLAELPIEFNINTDVRLLATVITGGAVEPVANLTLSGERLAGCLEWLPRGGNIFFEAYDRLVRQRFSIAHELGHFFLHAHLLRSKGKVHGDTTEIEDETADDTFNPVWEREANAFAAAFLIPGNDVQADIDHFGPAVPFLAERYQVAEVTLRRRLKTLEILAA